LREDERYAVKATPALTNGFITFGCCNNLSKISPDVITLWSRILLAIPTAKLLIEAPGLHQREFKKSFVARFEKNGLNADRLILKNRDTANQYLIYHDIDIALDPFPYNGGTTNCDLLWMSIPLITLPGSAEVSRLGLSFVSTIGHPDWAAKTPDEYVAKALELANDVGKLNETRLALRGEVERSPLMDGTLFAKNLEIAFHSMWRQYVESVITIL
jgi:predicted O-linked N-acetylglucosamine transferase (SPINDLY family)